MNAKSTLIAVASGALGLALGLSVGMVTASGLEPNITPTYSNSGFEPDWTVAPCSLWESTAKPKLPPYTVTTVCYYVDASGTTQLVWAPVGDQLPTK